MLEFELARGILALVMLAVASYSDMKTREVSDFVWLGFGGIGAMLYLFEPVNDVAVIYLVTGILVGLVGLAIRFVGQADCLCLVALTITNPNLDGLPVGVIVPIVAPILASVYVLCSNVFYNLSDLLHGRLFFGISEGLPSKALAFLVLHRKRKNEKFVFRAQTCDMFDFCLRPKAESEFAGDFQGYVVSALPVIPFMLGSFLLIIMILPFWH